MIKHEHSKLRGTRHFAESRLGRWFGELVLSVGLAFFRRLTIVDARRAPRGTGEIWLTFDDGPTPETTPGLLAVLAREGVPASFCMIGAQMAANPGLFRAVVAAGHRVVNHSYRHAPESLFDEAALRQEVADFDRLAASLAERDASFSADLTAPTGVSPRGQLEVSEGPPHFAKGGIAADKRGSYFRPPMGLLTRPVKAILAEQRLAVAHLTFFVNDAFHTPPEAASLLKRLQRQLRRHRGGAVVLHEACYGSGEAGPPIDKSWLPALVAELITWAKAEGFRFGDYPENENLGECSIKGSSGG